MVVMSLVKSSLAMAPSFTPQGHHKPCLEPTQTHSLMTEKMKDRAGTLAPGMQFGPFWQQDLDREVPEGKPQAVARGWPGHVGIFTR